MNRCPRWPVNIWNTLGIRLAVLAVAIGTVSGCSPPPPPVAKGPQPFLVVRVQSAERRDGQLIVRGHVRNSGSGSAYTPAVELTVFEDPGDTVLANEIAYPAGTYLHNLDPGHQAAFELAADLPAGTGQIRWTVTMSDYPGEVIVPQ